MNASLERSLAVAAAALFLAACSKTGDGEGAKSADSTGAASEIKCMGINECKGQGACGVPGGHSCAGQNECKGKGWIKASEADCTSKGGQVVAM
jgi:hypothetical protein